MTPTAAALLTELADGYGPIPAMRLQSAIRLSLSDRAANWNGRVQPEPERRRADCRISVAQRMPLSRTFQQTAMPEDRDRVSPECRNVAWECSSCCRIDVGTKQEIHRLLRQLVSQGKAVMVISSDLPEALRVSDRIAVMRAGRLVEIMPGPTATEERVMALAAGVSG